MGNSHSLIRTVGKKKGVVREPARPNLLPGGRRQRRAAETRIRLFRSALELIAKHGAANVTVEDITEAADVGKGTFFNYFQSKDHVLAVMAEIQLGKVRETAALAARRSASSGAVLRRLMLRLAEEPGRNPKMARAFLSSFQSSEEVRGIIRQHMQEARKTVADLVARGQERGEIDPLLKEEQVAIQLFQACMGTVLLWSLHERPALRTWMESTFEHFWRSIASPGGGRRL